MYRLPLFPLPAVLLPRARMPLHVFEPRYRRLVERCLEGDRRFGLIYHDPDRSGPFLFEEGRVGCVAEIEERQELPDGRSLTLNRGVERFAVREAVESGEPFYEAVVEPYEDRPVTSVEALAGQRRRSLDLFRAAVEAVAREGEDDGETADPLARLDPADEISFPLAATLRIQPEWKQAFLELRDEGRRLDRLDAIFRAALDASGEEEAG